MALGKGFLVLAAKLEEAATLLSASDVRTRLQNALSDYCEKSRKSGEYCYAYVVDVFGDDRTGTVVFSLSDELKQASYTCAADGASIAIDSAVDVVPITTYTAERVTEAGARNSKTDLKHLQAIHDASAHLGAECSTKESAAVDVTGDVIPLREGAVGQDGTAYLKLIAPGWGSSGYYSAEVLKRDGPKCFTNGTKNYWNHQTAAEESERPEGDLRDLASVLTEDARYEENGPAGAGLYAKAKVFEMFRQPVDELAKSIGMSIRATGKAKEGKAEGKSGPIIQELNRGISVDYVTTPGAGGKILQLFEAARKRTEPQPKEAATEMDAAEMKKLLEANNAAIQTSIQEANKPLIESNRKLAQRLAASESRTIIQEALKDLRLPQTAKDRIESKVSAVAPITESGDLDTAKLKLVIEAAIKEAGDDLAALGLPIVIGQGSGSGELTEAQRKDMREAEAKETDQLAARLGLRGEGARLFREGRNGFDSTYASSVAVAEGDDD